MVDKYFAVTGLWALSRSMIPAIFCIVSLHSGIVLPPVVFAVIPGRGLVFGLLRRLCTGFDGCGACSKSDREGG